MFSFPGSLTVLFWMFILSFCQQPHAQHHPQTTKLFRQLLRPVNHVCKEGTRQGQSWSLAVLQCSLAQIYLICLKS